MLAEASRTQPSYVTRVMKEEADFSLDQGAYLQEALRLSEEETGYFLSMIQLSRAATPAAKKIIKRQLEEMQKSQSRLSQKIASQEVSPDMGVVFRHWHHLAILSTLSLSTINSPKALADYLGISIEIALDSLRLLEALALIEKSQKFYRLKSQKLHLGNDSSDISSHHISWRQKAIGVLQERKPISGEFYSSVASVSRADLKRIQELFAQCTREAKDIIARSQDEVVISMNWDVFSVER